MQNSARCVLPVASTSNVAEDAIDQPGRSVAVIGNLLEGDFQFVDLIVARLIDARRLAGRADEVSAEQIRQRRMIVPIADQAA